MTRLELRERLGEEPRATARDDDVIWRRPCAGELFLAAVERRRRTPMMSRKHSFRTIVKSQLVIDVPTLGRSGWRASRPRAPP